MRIFVKAKPRSREEKVEMVDEAHFVVYVREPPEKGLANLAIRKALADHFGISIAGIEQLSGFSSSRKVFLRSDGRL